MSIIGDARLSMAACTYTAIDCIKRASLGRGIQFASHLLQRHFSEQERKKKKKAKHFSSLRRLRKFLSLGRKCKMRLVKESETTLLKSNSIPAIEAFSFSNHC